jgi:hypothetical protein
MFAEPLNLHPRLYERFEDCADQRYQEAASVAVSVYAGQVDVRSTVEAYTTDCTGSL